MIPDLCRPHTYRWEPSERATRWWPGKQWRYFCQDDDDYSEGYFRLLWHDRRDFVNVEHDVVPTTDQLLSLALCPQEWCCYPEYEGGPPTLSLARFRRGFIEANPSVWQGLLDYAVSVHQPTWTLCDSWLVAHADRAPHLHGPPWVDNRRPFTSFH